MPRKRANGRTVKDFRNMFFRRIGSRDPRDFNIRSEAHWAFWRELHRIPTLKRGRTPVEAKDIDEATRLTPEEWDTMSRRLEELLSNAA